MPTITVSETNCHARLENLSLSITKLKIWKTGRGHLPDSFFQELGRFVGLTKLDLCLCDEADRTIVDLGFLRSLQNLEILTIEETSPKSLENLACCPLKKLVLRKPFVDQNENPLQASLDFLKHCPFLVHLFIDEVNLVCEPGEEAQLSPIRHCPALETLSLRDCCVRSLKGIEDHPHLRLLIISLNLVTDLAPIANCVFLSELRVDGNPIRSLNGIEFCQNLREIHLSKNHLSTLSPLETLTELVRICFLESSRNYGLPGPDSDELVAETEALRARGVMVLDVTLMLRELEI